MKHEKPWWLPLAELGVTLAVWWATSPALRERATVHFWHGLSRTCYSTAHTLGTLGIHAETEYRKVNHP